MQNIVYPVLFLVLLFACLWIGWKLRGFVARFENMENVVKRRELPNTAKAGLEDIWAVSDIAKMLNGDVNSQLIALGALLKQSENARHANEKVFEIVMEIASTLRRDPKSYNPDEPLKDR